MKKIILILLVLFSINLYSQPLFLGYSKREILSEMYLHINYKLVNQSKNHIEYLNRNDDRVLGYFQVSAVKEKRIFISPSDIAWMDLPIYHYPCETVARNPGDYPPPFNTTFDEIYLMFCVWDDEYVFVEPIYFSGTFALNRLAFTKKECANCEWTGTSEIPDFWIDVDDP